MNDTAEFEPKSATDATEKTRSEAMPGLPDASVYPFSPVGTKPALGVAPPYEPKGDAKPSDHGGMFETLVSSDTDLVGMVAYGIYKHNKRDFFAAFERACGRMPDAAEIRAYMMGEATSRRAATYRHLAENFVAAQEKGGYARATASDAAVSSPAASPATPRPQSLVDLLRHRTTKGRRSGPSWLMAAYIAFLILLLVGIGIFIRTGFASGH